jgi:hypothetical protein
MKQIQKFDEFVSEGSFYRLPKDVIGTELYVANQSMQSLYSGAAAGDDISPKEIDFIIKNLQQVKSLIKKFNKPEEVIGTVYEANLDEASVQIAGKGKPAGAKVLATLIVKYLDDNSLMSSSANKKKITEELADLIMDSTF